jgi:hypothetical protein
MIISKMFFEGEEPPQKVAYDLMTFIPEFCAPLGLPEFNVETEGVPLLVLLAIDGLCGAGVALIGFLEFTGALDSVVAPGLVRRQIPAGISAGTAGQTAIPA